MTSNKVLFFCPKNTINEATEYYVDILKEAVKESGYEVSQSADFKDTKSFKNIFVMSAKWCFLVKTINPRANIITWFQGLGGEEALLTRNSKRDKVIWSMLESFAIKFSWLNIYVSKEMKEYLLGKCRITENNYFIMPCFNKGLNKNSFDYPKKYDVPSFVYAGGLDKWQCIEQTLELYKKIEDKVPHASITLLTKENQKATELIKKYNIKNSTIKFVSLNMLNKELERYKYGFLIRDDHIVNNVSTPTKMNSYLANGIIPIYTNVIKDFNANFDRNNFVLLDHKASIDNWSEQIVSSEINKNIDIEDYRNELSILFSKYYSRRFYIDEILNSSIF